MNILTLTDISLAFGHHPLLAQVNFQISRGERVCLIGRNGAGKSTLMHVISGCQQADEGEVWARDTLRISHLLQEVPEDENATVYDVVAGGLGELGQLLAEYHHLLHQIDADESQLMQKLHTLQQRIEVLDGWNIDQKVTTVISRLNLDADLALANCSGGMRRRVMLAKALVSEPDLLLLDEPTNHMDIAAINWLEEFLLGFDGALIFITHDRTFLKHLATRIVELDRGRLSSFPGDYDNYLVKKQIMLDSEAKAQAKFDKKLAQEETWIRQGVKARRTRDEGRVRNLLAMREARKQRINLPGKASLQVDSGELSGKIVADLQHVSFYYDDKIIIDDLSTRILRGDRVGIIGPNGSGKSTLLKIILGELKPSKGHVIKGTKIDTAYFDQHRAILDPEKSVRDNISEGSDYVSVKGRSRHVIGYLRSFLFPAERIDAPVKILSGGERNRLLLARLFTQPANMLVLDEPTNDLDVDTLELLEDLLLEFDGTLLLVSHDRTFVDNVVTSTLVFEDNGTVGEYVGGYEDWLRQRKAPAAKNNGAEKSTADEKPQPAKQSNNKPKTKLSYKEKTELENLPDKIETLENEQGELEQLISQKEFYQQDKDTISTTMTRMETIQKELENAYTRWEYLSEFE